MLSTVTMPTASTDLPAAPGARDIAEAGEAAVEAPAAEAVGGAEETEDADGISSMNGQELADRLGLSEWVSTAPRCPHPARMIAAFGCTHACARACVSMLRLL